MQMSGKAIHELQALIDANNWRHGRKHKGVSYATEDDRAHALFRIFRQLHQKLNMPLVPSSFRIKHVRAIANFWEQEGLSASTMQKRFSYLKTFSRWIGKAGMISGTLADYLQNRDAATRTYAAQHDKSWRARGIDVSAKIAEIAEYDKYVGAQLSLQRAMGMRAKEACRCCPHVSDQGALFHVKDGTKGGRERFIPIDTPEKRASIDHAKSVVDHPSRFLGDPSRSLKQNLKRYYTVLRKFGVTSASASDNVLPQALRICRSSTKFSTL